MRLGEGQGPRALADRGYMWDGPWPGPAAMSSTKNHFSAPSRTFSAPCLSSSRFEGLMSCVSSKRQLLKTFWQQVSLLRMSGKTQKDTHPENPR